MALNVHCRWSSVLRLNRLYFRRDTNASWSVPGSGTRKAFSDNLGKGRFGGSRVYGLRLGGGGGAGCWVMFFGGGGGGGGVGLGFDLFTSRLWSLLGGF